MIGSAGELGKRRAVVRVLVSMAPTRMVDIRHDRLTMRKLWRSSIVESLCFFLFLFQSFSYTSMGNNNLNTV